MAQGALGTEELEFPAPTLTTTAAEKTEGHHHGATTTSSSDKGGTRLAAAALGVGALGLLVGIAALARVRRRP